MPLYRPLARSFRRRVSRSPGSLSAPAAATYTQKYVNFDGSTYLELGSAGGATPLLTGQADLTEFSFCLWLNLTTAVTTSVYHVFAFSQSATPTTAFQMNKSSTAVNTNRYRIRAFDSGGVQILGVDSNTSVTDATGLKCLLVSGVSGGALQFYWGDTDESNVLVPWASGAIPFSILDFIRISNFATGLKIIGQCGGFAMYPTRYDFSNVTNRRLFIDAGGNPVSPPSGALVKMGFDRTAAQWPANQGSGGGTFTVTGALTDV